MAKEHKAEEHPVCPDHDASVVAALLDHIAKCDRRLQLLEAECNRRTQQLAEKEQAVQALQAQLAKEDQALQDLQTQLKAEQERLTQEKEQAVQALQDQLAEKEQAVQALHAQLAEREQAVAQAQAELQTERERLTQQLVEKEQAVQALTAQLDEVRAQAEAERERLTRELVAKEQALASITSSTAWDLVQMVGPIRLLLTPRGSRRERILRLVIHGLRVWKNEGFKAFAAKAMRRMMWVLLFRHEVSEFPNLRVGIDTTIPDKLIMGKGNALVVVGWCYHPHVRVTKLQILVSGKPHPVVYGLPRPDVYKKHWPELDPRRYSFRSGFCGIVEFPHRQEGCRGSKVDISLQATLTNGKTCVEWLGATELQPNVVPEMRQNVISRPESECKPEVAICMTTYNPPFDLFSKQINSICNQTYQDWICIISDDCSDFKVFQKMVDLVRQDNRFRLYRNDSRLGVYANSERVLSLVPEDVKFVALADQDDFWHSDKLQRLVAQAKAKTADGEQWLVYSDMNIVDREGTVLANTYWTNRPNNYKDLASLLMANTITGAACLFRRELLEYVLPFPRGVHDLYHDHWIGAVALAMGTVAYIDRPLYDYVQHPGQVIGHCVGPQRSMTRRIVGFGKAVVKCVRAREPILSIGKWQYEYFHAVMKIKLVARILELRCAEHITIRKRRVLQRLVKCDSGLIPFFWLIARGVRIVCGVPASLGREYILAKGILWKWYAYIAYKLERLCSSP